MFPASLPGSNYVVCKTQADVEPKLAQAKRLGAPVVFVEASEDADASAALVEAAASPEPNRIRGSRTESRSRRRVSFENRKDGEHFSSAKSAFERGVVVFGRPRQLMELRNGWATARTWRACSSRRSPPRCSKRRGDSPRL